LGCALLVRAEQKKLTMSDATIIREAVQPLTGSAQDYDSLLALIGDARFVLLGQASHGTHEF
jgi:erythromycin esterase-like protein